MICIVVHDIIQVVAIEVSNKGLTVRFNFKRKGARLEGIICLTSLCLDLCGQSVYKFHDCTLTAGARHKYSKNLACAPNLNVTNLLTVGNSEVFPGPKHLCCFRVLMHEDLVSTIDGDHVSISIAVHICKYLQVPKVSQLTCPHVHLVQTVRRRNLEELRSKRCHVEQLLATRLGYSWVAIPKIEVLLLPLVLQQLLFVLLLIEGCLLFLGRSIAGCGILCDTRSTRSCCSWSGSLCYELYC